MRDALDQKFNYFPIGVREKFINRLEKYEAKMRTPPGGAVSLYDVIPDSDIAIIETLGDDEYTPTASLIAVHRDMLLSEFGETGVKILEFMNSRKDLLLTDVEMAEALGCTERTIHNYRNKFTEKKIFLLEILGIS